MLFCFFVYLIDSIKINEIAIIGLYTVKNGVLQWLFIFDTPRGIIRLPWKLLIFQFKTQSFSETGLSLKLISLLYFVLTAILQWISKVMCISTFSVISLWVSNINNHWSIWPIFNSVITCMSPCGLTTD